jgi:type I restriction enzyme M protein
VEPGDATPLVDGLRYFYIFTPPRTLAEIDAELQDAESEVVRLLGQVTR